MTSSDENESWRLYADELTREQIEHLEYVQSMDYREYRDTPESREVELLDLACQYTERNRKNAEYADVPIPPGAEPKYDWAPDFQDGNSWKRLLQWTEYSTGMESVDVLINGWLKPDGTYTRQVGLYVEDEIEMTAEQARMLAAALLNAADDLDRC